MMDCNSALKWVMNVYVEECVDVAKVARVADVAKSRRE